jgi:hypothetical protein
MALPLQARRVMRWSAQIWGREDVCALVDSALFVQRDRVIPLLKSDSFISLETYISFLFIQ